MPLSAQCGNSSLFIAATLFFAFPSKTGSSNVHLAVRISCLAVSASSCSATLDDTSPNVQDLATKELKHIPDRYVRPEMESDDVVPVDDSIQIPVFDLSKLLDHQELDKFHSACKEWGFFQLLNHGVSEELIEKMKSNIIKFFSLPLEKKKASAQLPNHMEGYGQAFVMSVEQKLEWGDMHFLIVNPVPSRNLRFWPKTPTSFIETLEKYSMELRKVTTSLIGLMAKNLRLDPKRLRELFDDCIQGVRMNYYPPCPHADKVLYGSAQR